MGINNPKEKWSAKNNFQWALTILKSWTGDLPDAGRTPAGPPGNRIGSALATEMVIALTQLRSHARNANATEIDFPVRGRSNDGLTPPTSDILLRATQPN